LIVAGISCYDGFKKETFLLHAHVVSWSGDTPGLTKLMCLTGHNSYKGCRYCDIREIYMNHVYFPTTPPIGEEGNYKTYDPNNLPMRNHEQFERRIQQLVGTSSGKERYELEAEFGRYIIYYIANNLVFF